MRPITLTLYDPENQPLRTVASTSIPWRLVKLALSLSLGDPEIPADTECLLRAFAAEVFTGQVDARELDGAATVEELATVARTVIARYRRIAGLPVSKVEDLLVGIGWTLDAIDRTDAESLRRFVASLIERSTKRTIPMAQPKPAQVRADKRTLFADEVDWL